MKRERWGSRMLFIFAAVGSAAGLGNLWRFPYLAYKYGGGAFLIPYLTILILIGIPLLLLEFAIGQKFQKGAIEGMYAVNKNAAGVGLMGIFNGFIITGYYAVVISWVVLFFFHSFDLSWAGKESAFFYGTILNLSDNIAEVGAIAPPLLLGLIAVWLAIYFSIWKGAKSASKVILITMPLPIILVVVLAVRGLSLGTGSFIGTTAYLVPDLKKVFSDIDVWTAAISQIFFTLTLGFGTMIAYGSFNDENQELVKSTYWTVFLNSMISIIAGFAIFGTIGYMSYNLAVQHEVPYKMVMEYQKKNNVQAFPTVTGEDLEGKTVSYTDIKNKGLNISTEDVARYHLGHSKLAGPGLAFVVYPKAIAMFKPKWVAVMFGLLFFITLFTLGIDSAFSLVEAISTVIADEIHRRSIMVNRSLIALLVCIIGFLTGIIYTTRAGLYFLDIVDHYITCYGLVIVGLFQVIVAGWFFNTMKLKDYINSTTNVKLTNWWVFCIKVVVPIFLIYLFMSQLITDITTPYEGYPGWAQLIGWLVFLIPVFLSILFSLFLNMKRARTDMRDSDAA